MSIENSLGGGYKGLYGEVVTEDCYRLKQMKFKPQFVFDIGGNIGIFARFALELFPDTYIVSVEPDPQNCADFRRFTPTKDMGRILLIEAALGQGQIFHGKGAANGAGEVYLSAGLGYRAEEMERSSAMERANVIPIMLSNIFTSYHAQQKTLMKIDCEGAENFIWGHEPSMRVLHQVDYLVMELHSFGMTGRDVPEVIRATEEALERLKTTHDCEREGVYFWATKRI